MDKLGDMDLFVRVARKGGLASAGREVGLSPASMSARMNALEARHNTRLLNRSTRHVSLTETGQQFYEACLNILADVSEVESQILGSQECLKGLLRITAPSDLGQQHIMPVLSKFVDDNPEITPHLHLTDGIVNITEEGFDCAIRYGDLPDSSLIAKKLVSNHRVLCASPSYLKKSGTPKTPQELVDYDCLAMTRGTEPLTNWYFQSANKKGGLESVAIKASRSSNDGALIRRWAVEGAGIALKSFIEITEDVKEKRLVIVLDDYLPDFNKSDVGKDSNSADIHIIYPSRMYLPKRVKAFIGALEEYFSQF